MIKIATKEALERVAQALNDKIEKQAYIEVSGESITSGELTASEKAEIKKAIENGTIWDVLMTAPGGETLRVIAVSIPSDSIAVYSIEEEAIRVFAYE